MIENNENEFITHFKKYPGIEKLTRPMLMELIDTIYVHEGWRINVKIKQGDAFEKVLDYIEENRTKEKLNFSWLTRFPTLSYV